MTVIDELVRNADSYGESFSSGDLPLPPVKRVAVVVHEGDAHVIRNAGGVISDDAVRSLARDGLVVVVDGRVSLPA